jgi:hypothetical protein
MQLFLGAAAWWSRGYGARFPQPIPLVVTLTVMHTVMGALVLAGVVLITLISDRLTRPLGAAALPAALRATHGRSQQAAV